MFFRYIPVHSGMLRDVLARQPRLECSNVSQSALMNRYITENIVYSYYNTVYPFWLFQITLIDKNGKKMHVCLNWLSSYPSEMQANNCDVTIGLDRKQQWNDVTISFRIVSMHYRRLYYCPLRRKQLSLCACIQRQECYNIYIKCYTSLQSHIR